MDRLHWSQIVLLILSVSLFMFGASSFSSGKSAGPSMLERIMKKLHEFNAADLGSYLAIFMSCGLFILFVISFCSNIQPTEQFEDVSICDGLSSMEEKITCAELHVRKLITRADAFTEGDVGNDGQKNPRLVADILGKTRVAAGGPLIDCSPGHTGDHENRLTRLERTLQSFTDPIFKKALSASNTCEGFLNIPTEVRAIVPTNEERIATILALIKYQQTKYLKPIDDKVAALQRHEVSDCDKNKASSTFSAPS